MNKNKKAVGSNQTASRNTQINYTKLSTNKKNFPPYGRRLYDALQYGYKPNNDIFIFVGAHAWEKAKTFIVTHDVLVFPLNKFPDEFEWPVNNNSVLCFDTGGIHYQIIRKLAHSLLVSGATIVRVMLCTYELIVFRREGGSCK